MNFNRAIRIAVTPSLGVTIYLGLVAALALLQFVIINPRPFIAVVAFTSGYAAMALSLKLFMSAMMGAFITNTSEPLPRGAMLVTAIILAIIGLLLLSPLLTGPQI